MDSANTTLLYSALAGLLIGAFIGYLLFRFSYRRTQTQKTLQLHEQMRESAQTALEMFQPFHWEVLHIAILSQRFRQNGNSKNDEFGKEYLKNLLSLPEQFQLLLRNLDPQALIKIETILELNIRDEIYNLITTLGQAYKISQEQSEMNECFNLVESAYRDASRVEKTLRLLYRKYY
jgi:hypothetical protein